MQGKKIMEIELKGVIIDKSHLISFIDFFTYLNCYKKKILRDQGSIHTQSVYGILVEVVEFDVFVAEYIWVWRPALLILLQQIAANTTKMTVTQGHK